MSLSQEVEKYIENPMSDGYTAAKSFPSTGKRHFRKKCRRLTGGSDTLQS